MAGPEGRCGFTLNPEALGVDLDENPHLDNLDDWYNSTSAVGCWREPWAGTDTDWCVWHAEIRGKSDADLPRPPPHPERLDGACLQDATLGDTLDFAECVLKGADLACADLRDVNLTGADLQEADLADASLMGADLADASLVDADLADASLWWVTFTDADLRGADLTDADLTDANLADSSFVGADLAGAYLTDADLSEADLRVTDLAGAYLTNTDLSEAKLWGADLPGANLEKANFTDADLREADLTDANLMDADLTNADASNSLFPDVDLSHAVLCGCDLEGTDLTEVTLSGANLRGTRLHDADLFDVRINEETEFGDWCAYETEAFQFTPGPVRARLAKGISNAKRLAQQATGEGFTLTQQTSAESGVRGVSRQAVRQWLYHLRTHEHIEAGPTNEVGTDDHDETPLSRVTRLRRFLAARYRSYRRWRFWRRTNHDALEHPRENLHKATTVYRIYQRLHQENFIIGEEIPFYFVREQEVRRKTALANHKLHHWLNRAGQRWIMLYGESPWRVVYASIVIVLACGVLFPLWGGVSIQTTSPTNVWISPPTLAGLLPESLVDLLNGLYFSAVTFTTLGYGGMQPTHPATRFLAAVESLVGAMLIALLVGVLARRVTR